MNIFVSYKKFLFAQVLLGIIAFCIALENPMLLLIAGTIAAISWYVTQGPRSRCIPNWLVNVGVVLSLIWMFTEIGGEVSYLGLATGHFLMAMQIIVLYSRRGVREDSALVMLSVLLVVDAAVVNSTFLFGLFLIIYALVALPTLLLFNLKITQDYTFNINKTASTDPDNVDVPKATKGKNYGMQFRLASLSVGIICTICAVIVFMLFPRWAPGPMAAKVMGQNERSITGYSEYMQLGPKAPLPGKSKVVMHVKINKDGKNIGAQGIDWKIRGAALAKYNRRQHVWRKTYIPDKVKKTFKITPNTAHLAKSPKGVSSINATITVIEPYKYRMFSVMPQGYGMARVTSLHGYNLKKASYNQLSANLSADIADTNLGISGNIKPLTTYMVSTPSRVGQITENDPQVLKTEKKYKFEHRRWRHHRFRKTKKGENKADSYDTFKYAAAWHVHEKRIKKFSLKILKKDGIKQKKLNFKNSKFDKKVAQDLASYLRTNFQYTLDNPATPSNKDPITQFLFKNKSGHCELFAAGLAAMARSIGMQARVVTGYLASEYNKYGEYYVVRQRDAHSWTEIYCGPKYGWLSLDSTPPTIVDEQHARTYHWYTSFHQYYDFISSKWEVTIAQYDITSSHKNTGDKNSPSAAVSSSKNSWNSWVKNLLGSWKVDPLSYLMIVAGLIFLMVSVLIILRMLIVRKKKLSTLQLDNLSHLQRWRMGRKLRFYLTVSDMLERRGYKRPYWQSPFSFAQELADVNPGKFDPVISLTEIFYEIRFGHRELNETRRKKIRVHIKHLEEVLQ